MTDRESDHGSIMTAGHFWQRAANCEPGRGMAVGVGVTEPQDRIKEIRTMIHPLYNNVVGYTVPGAVYCLDCSEKEWPGITRTTEPVYLLSGESVFPMFKCSESDTPPSCDSCLEIIEGVTVLMVQDEDGEWDYPKEGA